MRFSYLTLLTLGLTPLVGMTVSLGWGLVLGLSWLVLSLAHALPQYLLKRGELTVDGKFLAAAGINLILVFALDLAWGVVLGQVYQNQALYIRILAFHPFFVILPYVELPLAEPVRALPAQRFEVELMESLGRGAFLFGLALIMGLLREGLGLGQITVWPDQEPVVARDIAPYLPRLLAGPAGGFLLAAAAAWLYSRWAEGAHLRLPRPARQAFAPPASPPSAPPTAPVEPPRSDHPEPPVHGADLPWGEQEDELIRELTRGGVFHKRRILVLGCGTGEEVWALAMKILAWNKDRGGPNVRIRGVDTFPTRIEAAKEGIYRESQFASLDEELKRRYLSRYKHEEAKLVKVNPEPRRYVEFLAADLLSPHVFFQKPADLVILHADLEFLPEAKRHQLFATIYEHLDPVGALILHHEVDRSAWSPSWKRTGNRVLRKSR